MYTVEYYKDKTLTLVPAAMVNGHVIMRNVELRDIRSIVSCSDGIDYFDYYLTSRIYFVLEADVFESLKSLYKIDRLEIVDNRYKYSKVV